MHRAERPDAAGAAESPQDGLADADRASVREIVGRAGGVLGSAVTLALLVACLGLALAAGGVLAAQQKDAASRELERRAQLLRETMSAETGRYTDTLRTLAAGFGSFASPTTANFDQATGSLADLRLAGAASIVYLVPAGDGQIPAVQAQWRRRGAAGLALEPAGTGREHIFSVWRRALDGTPARRVGNDVTRSPQAARALADARRTGRVTISDPYRLLIDQHVPAAQRQLSFVLTAPVHGPATAKGVRPFRGWLLMGLRGQDFAGAHLTDASRARMDVVVSVRTAGATTVIASRRASSGDRRDLARTVTTAVAGRTWQLRVAAPSGHVVTGGGLPVVVSAVGCVLAVLLAALIHLLSTGKARAQARVRAATAELAAEQAAARDQADLLTAIMDGMGDGVAVVDEQGRFLLHNPAARQMLGVPDSDGLDTWQEHYGIFLPDGVTPFPAQDLPMALALTGRPVEQVEMLIRNHARPDGAVVSVSARPLHSAAGLRGAVAVFHDITVRSRADAELAAAADSLRAAHDQIATEKTYLNQILDAINVAVVTCDTDQMIVHANRTARAVLPPVGGRVGLAEAAAAVDLHHLDRTPITLDRTPLMRALDGEAIDAMDALVPLPGGSHRSVVLHARPLRALDGTITGAVAASYDATALREREDELRAFAGIVAHDLKSPLAAIAGYAELLTDQLTEGVISLQMAHHADRIRVRAENMGALIDDLLTYATARDGTLHPVPVALRGLVDQIVTEHLAGLHADTPAPQIYVGALPEVLADPALLRQVLTNLIGNAVKYTPPGQPPRIDITADQAADGHARIRIADRGIGIPAGQHTAIFGSFHRAHPGASYDGTGLGLAICHRIITRHGGSIAATDNPGGGTRFTFTLPTAPRTDARPEHGFTRHSL